jgi:(p)ppGpp synthase/HD superfamily hydrolase
MTSEFYRDLALRYHGEQRYGDHPYGVHLDAVVEILREYGHEALVPAGYLHDTLEDTDATPRP